VSPGVITDVLGLVLLFPPTRRVVAAVVRRRLEKRVAAGTLRVTTMNMGGPFAGGPTRTRPSAPRIERRPGDEVDAEFTEDN